MSYITPRYIIFFRQARDLVYLGATDEQRQEVSSAFNENFSKIFDERIERESLSYKHSESIWKKVRVMSLHQQAVSEVAWPINQHQLISWVLCEF